MCGDVLKGLCKRVAPLPVTPALDARAIVEVLHAEGPDRSARRGIPAAAHTSFFGRWSTSHFVQRRYRPDSLGSNA